jgi:hypothetical protein
MGGANLTNFTKCLEGDKVELWSVFFNVREMAFHMGSFIVLKLANVNDWELGLAPLLPSLQMTHNPNTPQWIKLVLNSHLISLIIAFGSNF